MGIDGKMGLNETSYYDRNKEYIAGKEVDVSVEALSRVRNVNLPSDFNDKLQSSDFYSTERAMPAQYPLLLLPNVATVMIMNEVKAFLVRDNVPTKNAVNLYVKQKTGGREVATPVGKVNLSLKFLNMLNYYLVEYTYYIAKGQRVAIDRASLVDYEEFNPIIDPGENVMSYSDVNRVPVREKADIGIKSFSDILRELQESQAPKTANIPLDMVPAQTNDIDSSQSHEEESVTGCDNPTNSEIANQTIDYGCDVGNLGDNDVVEGVEGVNALT